MLQNSERRRRGENDNIYQEEMVVKYDKIRESTYQHPNSFWQGGLWILKGGKKRKHGFFSSWYKNKHTQKGFVRVCAHHHHVSSSSLLASFVLSMLAPEESFFSICYNSGKMPLFLLLFQRNVCNGAKNKNGSSSFKSLKVGTAYLTTIQSHKHGLDSTIIKMKILQNCFCHCLH